MARSAEIGSRGTVRGRVVGAISLLIIFSIGVAYGIMADKRRLFPYGLVRHLYYTTAGRAPDYGGATPGKWRPRRASQRHAELTDAQRAEIERLAALGYLTGIVPAGQDEGVTLYDPVLAYDGLNLLTSGHAPEALLLDMRGEVLHGWTCDFWAVWPDWEEARGVTGAEHWACARLFRNGDLLAIFEGFGIVKLDRDSNLLWSYDGGSHHDLFVTGDGLIYTLDQEPRMVPRINEERPVLEDFITVLSPDGELVRRFSVYAAFERSRYAPILSAMPAAGDILHTNTIEVLDGRLERFSPAFRKGNVLISVLKLDTLAVVDMETETVVWALSGRWRRQHDPSVLENGRMLLFNNWAGDEASEVVEFDPFTQDVVWSFKGDEVNDFYSRANGATQRLPNGNTVIVESANGRVFEVTPDKTFVWEYVNPHRAGAENELIATVRAMVRLPPDFPLDWMETRPSSSPASG